MYLARNNFDAFIMCLPMSVTAVIFFITYTFFIVKMPEILDLLNNITQDFKEIEPFKEEIRILKKSGKEGHFAVLLYAIYIAISIVGFLTVTLIPQILDVFLPLNETREKLYALEVEYLFFDKSEHYTFVYIHSLIVGAFVISTICTSDIMLYSFIQHACGMYRVLCYRLENIINETNNNNQIINIDKYEDDLYKTAVSCVTLHNKILRYVKKVNTCLSVYLFLTYGCIIPLMTFQGAMIIVKSNNLDLMIKNITYYFGQIIHLLYNCIPGQKLKDHSIAVNEYLYGSHWYEMPSRTRKVLLLMMMRNSRESKISVGKFTHLSLETYSMLLKTIFSYLSVLMSATM